jgi:hypothetical protein
MAVSSGDHRFMQRIGRYKAASHASATARHLALPLAERLERSWDLYTAYRSPTGVRIRSDDPSAFYARARRLGLYSGH